MGGVGLNSNNPTLAVFETLEVLMPQFRLALSFSYSFCRVTVKNRQMPKPASGEGLIVARDRFKYRFKLSGLRADGENLASRISERMCLRRLKLE